MKKSTKILIFNLVLQIVVAIDLIFLNPAAIYWEIGAVTLVGLAVLTAWKKGR